MIKGEEAWLEMLNARNSLAHIYSEADSIETAELVKTEFYQRFMELKQEIDENWGTFS